MTTIAFLVLYFLMFAYFQIKINRSNTTLRNDVYMDIDVLTENLVSVVKGFNRLYLTVYPQNEPKKSLTKKK